MIDEAKNMFEPIDRVRQIDLDTFNDLYALPRIPLVIENMSYSWPATQNWSISSFKERFGDHVKLVTKSNDSTIKKLRFKDYVYYMENVNHDHAFYLKNWEFVEDCPELLNEYEVLPHFESWLDFFPQSQRPNYKWIYIGPNKSYSKLHIDIFMTNAWNILFEGKKLWFFFPPSESEKLKANHFHPKFPGYSFPVAKGLKGYYAVQSPGEIMFTPGDWFHQVYNLEKTLALTENYVNATNYDLVENHLKQIGNTKMASQLAELKRRCQI
ncbi:cupin-like domain-containing protein [Fulvivirga kasyanovii]|uniref:JmjC domain-containing protein n=1 Tax=Fulvivirga kasyanovii TaxID=396812 RepID=A0ABW9RPL7_9BACT|nr:cupin-like domain-containing protein [Fulvivirga kasyanovii]MTI26093.1 hypothetical protein [Fulvivirga kasyanovii]